MRIGNKKLGLSRQLEDECFHHNITIRFNAKKKYDEVKGEVEKVVNDVGRTVEKAVNDTGKYLSENLGNDILDGANYALDAYGGIREWEGKALQWVDDKLLNNNIDLYTGNLITDYENMTRTFSAIGEGTAVDDNLRSTARVGAVAGAAVASGGTAALTVTALTPDAGNRSWEELFGGLAKAGGAIGGNPITQMIGDTVNNIVNPADEVFNGFTGDSNPYPTTIIEAGGINPQKVIPLIVIGVVLLTVAGIATKKRKK